MKEHRFFLVLMLLLTPPCASLAAEAQEVTAQFNLCISQLRQSPSASALASTFPVNPMDASHQQLSDSTRPTPAEKEHLNEYMIGLTACRRQLWNFLDPQDGARDILGRAWSASEWVAAGLIEGRLSWGEANSMRKQIAEESEQALREASAAQHE